MTHATHRSNIITDRSGATIVEAAFVMPLYLMFIFGIVGWSFVLWQINALQYAAEKTARCSVLPTDLQGNRLCVNWSNINANYIGWIPSISTSSILPNTTTSGTSFPSTSRTFQSTRTGTSLSYNVNCVAVTISNNFISGFDSLPSTLQQNFCRPDPS